MHSSFRAGLLAVTLAGTTSALYAASGTENDAQHRWKLSDMYASQAAWDQDAQRFERQLGQIAACKGQLGRSVLRFKTCLDLDADARKRIARLYSYAAQLHDEDTSVNFGIDLRQRAEVLYNKLGETTSFQAPEIQKLGAKKVRALLQKDKTLAIYQHPLNDILRSAAHTLDSSGEALLATLGQATGAASSIYSTLSDADMPWPKVKLANGTEVTLDQPAYEKYRASGDRDERKRVFDAFWKQWKGFERTFGVAFYEQLKKDAALAKVRRYPDSLTHALDANQLPVAVYDTMVREAEANLPTLHRYFRLRARMLGVGSDMRYYDIYPPLLPGSPKYSIEQGVALMLASVAPLGEEYVAAMKKGTQSGWMDVYPRPRKRSGAYMNGSAYDVHPYLLLNHLDDYESVSVLAHEFGHAMHSYLSNQHQPFITSDYPTFTAEIASTTNEVFLLEHMLKVAKTDSERLLVLGSALENLRGTFYRQAMFAAFEREVHARVDKGESLTGEAFTKIYGDLLRRYHGEKEGVVKIDDLYTVEWAFIPHFYNRFYVFQYATSVSAGNMFAAEILKGTPGARERYLGILKAGGSRYPYELVKEAGVDLASPAPYQALVRNMNSIMDRIEGILAKKG